VNVSDAIKKALPADAPKPGAFRARTTAQDPAPETPDAEASSEGEGQ
jgi:large subunit ribosomal protein L3